MYYLQLELAIHIVRSGVELVQSKFDRDGKDASIESDCRGMYATEQTREGFDSIYTFCWMVCTAIASASRQFNYV